MSMWTHGKFYWNELMTNDAEKAKAFYASTIGWTFDAMPMPDGTYWVAKIGSEPAGGIFPMTGPEFARMSERWVSYLAVDDVDARIKQATTAGAKVMKPAFDVPGVGRMAFIEEPGGAMIGWITPVTS
jgi:predicted enzyme related to lactoylglutathione lyase